MPVIKQLFIGRMCPAPAFERTLFMIRKRAGRRASEAGPRTASTSRACRRRTVVYKGLALPERLDGFYLDLREPTRRAASSRSSTRASARTRSPPGSARTRTGASRTTARSTRSAATRRGWRAREPLLESEAFGEHLADFKPIIRPGGSDSASLDNVVDFLVDRRAQPAARDDDARARGVGRAAGDAARAARLLRVPRVAGRAVGRPGRAALHRRHVHRRHARPQRPAPAEVRRHARAASSSRRASSACSTSTPEDVVEKGRLQPGRMLLVDIGARAASSATTRSSARSRRASRTRSGSRTTRSTSRRCRLPRRSHAALDVEERRRLLRAFGYTREDLRMLLDADGQRTARSPSGSMGNDAPLAVLSERPQPLFRYFKQQFAQVTNPPIDPDPREAGDDARELRRRRGQPARARRPGSAGCSSCDQPVLTHARTWRSSSRGALADFPVRVAARPCSPRRPDAGRVAGAGARCELCAAAERAVRRGSQHPRAERSRRRRASTPPFPSLLATSAVHHAPRARRQAHARRARRRDGRGARGRRRRAAHRLRRRRGEPVPRVRGHRRARPRDARATLAAKHYVHALDKGLLKVMSKMGISCLSSYQGAQIFEAVGIGQATIDRWFPGTASRVGGIGLRRDRARGASCGTRAGYREPIAVTGDDDGALDVGGVYAWRVGGERHLWSPKTVASLQKAVRLAGREVLRRLRPRHQRSGRPALHPARLLGPAPRRRAGAARRGRAGREDRASLRDRRDELRQHQQGGAREPRHRDEPHRRQVQQRRGRRGRRALRPAAQRRSRGAAPSSRWRAPASA